LSFFTKACGQKKGWIRAISSFLVKTRLLLLDSARAAHRPRVQKKTALALVFSQSSMYLWKSSISNPDEQATLQDNGRSRPKPASELQTLSIRKFDGWVRLLGGAFDSSCAIVLLGMN